MTSRISNKTNRETSVASISSNFLTQLPTALQRKILNFIPKELTIRLVNRSFRNLSQLDKYLCFSGLDITDACLKKIVERDKGEIVVVLLCNCSNITNEGFKYLADLYSLRELSLAGCPNITDEGFKHLADLHSLRQLNLWNCLNITNEGLKYLANLHLLTQLDLSGCSITDEGIEHLVDLHSLTHLNLARCEGITDRGFEHLANLGSLIELDLTRCFITNKVLIHLANNLHSLTRLNLINCFNITDEGLEYLKTHLPSLTQLKQNFTHSKTPKEESVVKNPPIQLVLEPLLRVYFLFTRLLSTYSNG